MFKQAGEDKVPLDVNTVVRAVLSLLRGDLEKRKISVATALSGGLPRSSADPRSCSRSS